MFREAFHSTWVRVRGAVLAAATIAFCAPAAADFVNGNFENGTTGWTVSSYYNNSVTTLPPTRFSDLGLTSGGTANFTVATGQYSVANYPDSAGTSPLLVVPHADAASGHVNATSSSRPTGRLTTEISQTITTTAADVNAADGLVHVHMTIAPVLNDPSHQANQQPYFYVEVYNETTSTVVYSLFNYSNEPGVSWQTLGANKYTDWQTIDVPGTNITVGDRITVRIVAAACSQGGHSGDVYVDNVTTGGVASLAIAATGPATARPGDSITYTYTYSNNTTTATNNNVVTIVAPQVLQQGSSTVLNLTYASINIPGYTCTTPAVGSAGTVTCNVGTLAAGASNSFQITWTIPTNASTTSPTNVVGHGNYNIAATGVPAVNGGLVNTTLLPLATAVTDLGITITDGVTTLTPNAATVYSIVVTNNGPTDVTNAPLTQLSSGVTLGSWTCAGSGSCSASSGSGAISGLTVNLAIGQSVTITQNATAGATGSTDTLVTVAAPATVPESNSSNNSARDTNIGSSVVSAPTTSTPQPVPSLSTWALIGLSMLMGLFGLSARRRAHKF